MITYIDNSNRDMYNKLFDEAVKDLNELGGKPNATINSLESYFTYIKDLSELATAQDEHYGRKYTILPIQEEYFEIDANSRTITVPEVFRKNGLGVQGDNTAETIYFKINRYYDAMDLNTTDIYIQWENSTGEQGFSKEWVRDIYTFDDYLVFGWVLGDTMINQPGTMKFSVRFIKTKGENDQKVVQYSLSTLTAQALINPGLDFDINSFVYRDDLNALLASNFENTTTKTDSEIQEFAFVYNFDNLIASDNSNLVDDLILADLVDDKLEFLISAYVDKGTLRYSLYKQKDSSIDVNHDILVSENGMSIVYKTAKGSIYSLDKTYYAYDSEADAYEAVNSIAGLAEGDTITSENYYEAYGRYELSIANDKTEEMPLTGLYYGTAVVEMPDGSETSPRITVRQVKLLPPTAITIKNTENVTGYAVNTEIVPEFDEVANNALTYHWSKKGTEAAEFSTIVDAETANYTPTEQGIYKFSITSTRNGDSIESNEHLFYVTPVPVADDITIQTPSEENGEITIGSAFRCKAVYAPVNQLDGTDYSVEFTWKDATGKVFGSGETTVEDGAYVNRTDSTGAIAGQTYYCTVKATYNDLSVEKDSLTVIAVN